MKGPAPCHCPYCGHSGASSTFFTQEQIEYAKSVVFRQVTEAIRADLKSLEFEHKPRGPFGIGISMKLQPSASLPIRYYREKRLETEIVCDNCTLKYAIYGVFGWCPDCGAHNSLQILTKNLELAQKELVLAESVDKELADHLVGDALENVVSAFDGFGREICARRATDVHFQNLNSARRKVQEAFGIDFADGLTPAERDCAGRIFQKRHLLAHRMGVIDTEYIQKANDPVAAVGRKVTLSGDEVTSIVRITDALGRRLYEGLLRPKP